MTVNEHAVDGGEEPPAEEYGLELLTDEQTHWTVVPRDATGVAQLSQWITIDPEGMVDLEERR